MTDIAAATQPWYRTLGPGQWKTLIAANLGWVFDGYETYALIISVGVALRQLLDPALCGHGNRAHPARLGDRRHDRGRGCRLCRAQACDDSGDPRLFDPDRAQRVCLGLAVVRGIAVSRGACDRLRMGDRHLDRF